MSCKCSHCSPVIDKRAFARAVIVVDVVSTFRRARALQFCLATMAWTPARHPVHSRRERTRMVSVDLSQSGAPLPSTTLQLSPRSFTMATQQVLSSISPAKRPAPTFALPPKICFNVSNAPGPSTFPDRSEIRPLVFSPRGKGRMEKMDSLRSRRILDLPATGSQASRRCPNPLPYVVGQ